MKCILLSVILLLAGCNHSALSYIEEKANDMCIGLGYGTAISMDVEITNYSKHQEISLHRVVCANAKEITPFRVRKWIR